MRPLYITGPTGSGKSSIAATLASCIGGEVVNADAYQLYSHLEIVSASPEMELKRMSPHHLYGILDPAEDCNAARYRQLASPTIDSIIARGKRPVVVGGSGLYMKSLTHGLADLPGADRQLRQELEQLSPEQLVQKLKKLDPESAATLDPLNRRYVTRALEISILTGRPASEIKKGWQNNSPDIDGIFISRQRNELYTRINDRVRAMFDEGLVEEIRMLPETLSTTAAKAIGIRETRAYIEGEITREQCIDAISQASRRYAKRQLTWFKREQAFQMVCLREGQDTDSAVKQILCLYPQLGHA